jgi:hypothetical protein
MRTNRRRGVGTGNVIPERDPTRLCAENTPYTATDFTPYRGPGSKSVEIYSKEQVLELAGVIN